jgi:hypothetical protein
VCGCWVDGCGGCPDERGCWVDGCGECADGGVLVTLSSFEVGCCGGDSRLGKTVT